MMPERFTLPNATIDGEPLTGANIVLIPDQPGAFAVPGGDPADVLHVTVKYLFSAADWDADQRAKAERIVGDWAAVQPGPFTGTVGGVGTLGDAGAVVYHLDLEGLTDARKSLSDAIDVGTTPETTDTYDGYTPHLTAGYNLEPFPERPPGRYSFSRCRIQWADEVVEFPLGPEARTAAVRRPRLPRRDVVPGDDWRHDYHDPATGRFAPLGYVSPRVLAALLSEDPRKRFEAERAIAAKFDSLEAREWLEAYHGAPEGPMRAHIARKAREEIIGPRPPGVDGEARRKQRAWDAASRVVARGLDRPPAERGNVQRMSNTDTGVPLPVNERPAPPDPNQPDLFSVPDDPAPEPAPVPEPPAPEATPEPETPASAFEYADDDPRSEVPDVPPADARTETFRLANGDTLTVWKAGKGRWDGWNGVASNGQKYVQHSKVDTFEAAQMDRDGRPERSRRADSIVNDEMKANKVKAARPEAPEATPEPEAPEADVPDGPPKSYKLNSLRVGDIIARTDGTPIGTITDVNKGDGVVQFTYTPAGGGADKRTKFLSVDRKTQAWRVAPTRRSPEQIAEDRQRLLDHVRERPGRAPEWANRSDIAALQREGKLVVDVRTEYDKQVGIRDDLFGGTGAVRRQRAYLSLPKAEATPEPETPETPGESIGGFGFGARVQFTTAGGSKVDVTLDDTPQLQDDGSWKLPGKGGQNYYLSPTATDIVVTSATKQRYDNISLDPLPEPGPEPAPAPPRPALTPDPEPPRAPEPWTAPEPENPVVTYDKPLSIRATPATVEKWLESERGSWEDAGQPRRGHVFPILERHTGKVEVRDSYEAELLAESASYFGDPGAWDTKERIAEARAIGRLNDKIQKALPERVEEPTVDELRAQRDAAVDAARGRNPYPSTADEYHEFEDYLDAVAEERVDEFYRPPTADALVDNAVDNIVANGGNPPSGPALPINERPRPSADQDALFGESEGTPDVPEGAPVPVGITPSGAPVYPDRDFVNERASALGPGDLIANAERGDGMETVEVLDVRRVGPGRTAIRTATGTATVDSGDILRRLRRADEGTLLALNWRPGPDEAQPSLFDELLDDTPDTPEAPDVPEGSVLPADVNVGDVVRFTPSGGQRAVTIRVTDAHDGVGFMGYRATVGADGTVSVSGDQPRAFLIGRDNPVEVVQPAAADTPDADAPEPTITSDAPEVVNIQSVRPGDIWHDPGDALRPARDREVAELQRAGHNHFRIVTTDGMNHEGPRGEEVQITRRREPVPDTGYVDTPDGVDVPDVDESPEPNLDDIPFRPGISWVGTDGVIGPDDPTNALKLLADAKRRRQDTLDALIAEHGDDRIADAWRARNPEPTKDDVAAALADSNRDIAAQDAADREADRNAPLPDVTPPNGGIIPDGERRTPVPPLAEGATRVTRQVRYGAAPDVKARTAKLNERIAKKGLGEPVVVHVSEPYVAKGPGGDEGWFVDVDLDVAAPPQLPGGWKLASVADWSATDTPLVHNVGEGDYSLDLTADDVDRHRCDHCGSRRKRNRVFALKGEDGTVVHVGSTCIADFLGHDAEGKILSWPGILAELEDDDFYDGGGGQSTIPTDLYIAAAYAAVQKFGWWKADSNSPTRGTAGAILRPSRYDREDSEMAEAIKLSQAPETLEYARQAIEWARTMTPESDFDRNLQAVALSDEIGYKALGIAAYLPVAYARHLDAEAFRRQREAEEADRPKVPVPEGKQTVEGSVIALSWKSNPYGDSILKMTVADDRGFRVWVTAPAAIADSVRRGDRVRFNATLTRSDDDEHFGFGKRPTKAEVLADDDDPSGPLEVIAFAGPPKNADDIIPDLDEWAAVFADKIIPWARERGLVEEGGNLDRAFAVLSEGRLLDGNASLTSERLTARTMVNFARNHRVEIQQALMRGEFDGPGDGDTALPVNERPSPLDWQREAGDFANVPDTYEPPPNGFYNEDVADSDYVTAVLTTPDGTGAEPFTEGSKVLWARTPDSNDALGYLRYTVDYDVPGGEDGEPAYRIDMLRTNPEFDRQGVATWLTEALFQLEGISAEDVDATFTEDGAAFWNRRFGTNVRANDTAVMPINETRRPTIFDGQGDLFDGDWSPPVDEPDFDGNADLAAPVRDRPLAEPGDVDPVPGLVLAEEYGLTPDQLDGWRAYELVHRTGGVDTQEVADVVFDGDRRKAQRVLDGLRGAVDGFDADGSEKRRARYTTGYLARYQWAPVGDTGELDTDALFARFLELRDLPPEPRVARDVVPLSPVDAPPPPPDFIPAKGTRWVQVAQGYDSPLGQHTPNVVDRDGNLFQMAWEVTSKRGNRVYMRPAGSDAKPSAFALTPDEVSSGAAWAAPVPSFHEAMREAPDGFNELYRLERLDVNERPRPGDGQGGLFDDPDLFTDPEPDLFDVDDPFDDGPGDAPTVPEGPEPGAPEPPAPPPPDALTIDHKSFQREFGGVEPELLTLTVGGQRVFRRKALPEGSTRAQYGPEVLYTEDGVIVGRLRFPSNEPVFSRPRLVDGKVKWDKVPAAEMMDAFDQESLAWTPDPHTPGAAEDVFEIGQRWKGNVQAFPGAPAGQLQVGDEVMDGNGNLRPVARIRERLDGTVEVWTTTAAGGESSKPLTFRSRRTLAGAKRDGMWLRDWSADRAAARDAADAERAAARAEYEARILAVAQEAGIDANPALLDEFRAWEYVASNGVQGAFTREVADDLFDGDVAKAYRVLMRIGMNPAGDGNGELVSGYDVNDEWGRGGRGYDGQKATLLWQPSFSEGDWNDPNGDDDRERALYTVLDTYLASKGLPTTGKGAQPPPPEPPTTPPSPGSVLDPARYEVVGINTDGGVYYVDPATGRPAQPSGRGFVIRDTATGDWVSTADDGTPSVWRTRAAAETNAQYPTEAWGRSQAVADSGGPDAGTPDDLSTLTNDELNAIKADAITVINANPVDPDPDAVRNLARALDEQARRAVAAGDNDTAGKLTANADRWWARIGGRPEADDPAAEPDPPAPVGRYTDWRDGGAVAAMAETDPATVAMLDALGTDDWSVLEVIDGATDVRFEANGRGLRMWTFTDDRNRQVRLEAYAPEGGGGGSVTWFNDAGERYTGGVLLDADAVNPAVWDALPTTGDTPEQAAQFATIEQFARLAALSDAFVVDGHLVQGTWDNMEGAPTLAAFYDGIGWRSPVMDVQVVPYALGGPVGTPPTVRRVQYEVAPAGDPDQFGVAHVTVTLVDADTGNQLGTTTLPLAEDQILAFAAATDNASIPDDAAMRAAIQRSIDDPNRLASLPNPVRNALAGAGQALGENGWSGFQLQSATRLQNGNIVLRLRDDGADGAQRHIVIGGFNSSGGQRITVYRDGIPVKNTEGLPAADFLTIASPSTNAEVPASARPIIDRAKMVANDRTMLVADRIDAVAAMREELVAALTAEAAPVTWGENPGIVKAVNEFGGAIRDLVHAQADVETYGEGTESPEVALSADELAQRNRRADMLVMSIDSILTNGVQTPNVGYNEGPGYYLDGMSLREWLADHDATLVAVRNRGRRTTKGGNSAVMLAYEVTNPETGERVQMGVLVDGSDYRGLPASVQVAVAVPWKSSGVSRTVKADTPGALDTAPNTLEGIRGLLKLQAKLDKSEKVAKTLAKSDEPNATGRSQRRNARAAKDVLRRLGINMGASDDARERVQVGKGAGVIGRGHRFNAGKFADAWGGTAPIRRVKPGRGQTMSDAELVDVGLSVFPSSWIDSLGDHRFLVARRSTSGGYNLDLRTLPGGAGRDGSLLSIPGDGRVGENVVAHEVGHTMENYVPGLQALVIGHLDQLHEPTDHAKSLGAGWGKMRGYEDDIKRPYARRIYVKGWSREPSGAWATTRERIDSTEYLTTAIESLAEDGGADYGDFFGQDDVQDGFILGVLATFDPLAVAGGAAPPAP